MLCYLERQKQEEMKVQHYILVIVFFLGLSMINALLPINVNTLLIAFFIVYLMQYEDAEDV